MFSLGIRVTYKGKGPLKVELKAAFLSVLCRGGGEKEIKQKKKPFLNPLRFSS